ncbi:MAG: ABC transporter ATP-binding protein, partial [Bacilli bacterium]|nr:ABC transporter ATP-binding protein [Bacilli bacterium]
MLELKKITKKYLTDANSVSALKGIDLKFRESEFVSILGPSGCGKTTLLNIIGGLDNYTSGDLIINGKSTKSFKDKNWDNYRNHRVGFVFQNYNLIPHQTVLQNVELALTLAGVSKTERKKRAIKALKDVGLGDQIHKKPSQMSGGQMQRVAIARALVSNPDILLADEPTGALDSKTSIQIMELLKEIAKDKLVIMVTHNPELAEVYSTRIIKLLDGKVIDDTNSFDGESEKENTDKTGKTNMSFLTAFLLSLNNLLTKKGRTILTAFAGSIGIIGIALILSLSNGMQKYINNVEEETLSSYPITIEENALDTTEMLNTIMSMQNKENNPHDDNQIHSNNITNEMLSMMSKESKSNNLAEFKKYIDNKKNGILEKTNAVQYSYNLDLNIYRKVNNKYVQVSPNQLMDKMGLNQMAEMQSLFMGSASTTEVFYELLDNDELNEKSFEVLAGHLPKSYDEVVLVVDENNEISDYTLYSIGYLDSDELVEKTKTLLSGGKVDELEVQKYTYDELLKTTFKVLLNTDYYQKSNGIWRNMEKNQNYMNKKLDNSLEIKIVGIVKSIEQFGNSMNAYGRVGYTHDLTEYVVNKINESAIAKEQIAKPEINIFTGSKFSTEKFDYNNLSPEQKAHLATLSEAELAATLE